jgi:hypothetical protein
MNTESMSNAYRDTAWEWHVEQRAATTLPAAPMLRWLQVNTGRVWLTGGAPGMQAQDIWLQAGERHALPPGTQWVLEGEPCAALSLLQPPPRPAPALLDRALAWWNATRPRSPTLAGRCGVGL